jgi:hypothetical protein
VWTHSLEKRPELRRIGMTLGTCNVRSLYRAGSLISVARDISEYMVDLVGSDRTGLAPNQQANIHISMEREMRIMN